MKHKEIVSPVTAHPVADPRYINPNHYFIPFSIKSQIIAATDMANRRTPEYRYVEFKMTTQEEGKGEVITLFYMEREMGTDYFMYNRKDIDCVTTETPVAKLSDILKNIDDWTIVRRTAYEQRQHL